MPVLAFSRESISFNGHCCTKPKDVSLQSVRSTGHDIRSRDVDAHGTAGPQFQSRSAKYRKSYARGFSERSNPKPGDSAENESHRQSTPY
jgi:hypothetical protein